MTPSCRGWIGEEDEDEDREDIGEIEGEASEISEGVEREKVKRKPRGPRKKRIDTRILEDVAVSICQILGNINMSYFVFRLYINLCIL